MREVRTGFALILVLLIQSTTVSVTAGESVTEEQVVQEVSGIGPGMLPVFTVKDRWDIRWQAKGGSVAIWLHDENGKVIRQAADQSQPGAGSAHESKGGTYYLRLATGGTTEWTVTVIQLP